MKLNRIKLFFLFIIVVFYETAICQDISNNNFIYSKSNQSNSALWGEDYQKSVGRGRYRIPRKAYSIDVGDIDLDGNMDIVVGHNFSSVTQWSGVSVLLNDGFGYFELYDSVYLFAGQPDIQSRNLNSGSNLEIIAKNIDIESENEYIAVINDFNLDDVSYYSLNTFEGVDRKTSGDVNGDTFIDIVVSSNDGQFWGVMYNNGNGQLLKKYSANNN
jgi:hypothetical protein